MVFKLTFFYGVGWPLLLPGMAGNSPKGPLAFIYTCPQTQGQLPIIQVNWTFLGQENQLPAQCERFQIPKTLTPRMLTGFVT